MLKGCLNCHFNCFESMTRELGLIPLEAESRNKDKFLELLRRPERRAQPFKCSKGKWDSERIGVNNFLEIEQAVFRKDRDKCPLFSLYDPTASLEAVELSNKRIEEVIDRKFTRRLAWAALILSTIATLLASILPHYLSNA